MGQFLLLNAEEVVIAVEYTSLYLPQICTSSSL